MLKLLHDLNDYMGVQLLQLSELNSSGAADELLPAGSPARGQDPSSGAELAARCVAHGLVLDAEVLRSRCAQTSQHCSTSACPMPNGVMAPEPQQLLTHGVARGVQLVQSVCN